LHIEILNKSYTKGWKRACGPLPIRGYVEFACNFLGFTGLSRLVIVMIDVWLKKKPLQSHNFHNWDSNEELGVWD